MVISNFLNFNKLSIFAIMLFLPFVGTSYYFSSLSLAPFSIVGYLLSLFFFVKFNGFKSKNLYPIYIYIFLSFFFFPVSLYWIIHDGLNFRVNTFIGILLGLVLFISSGLLAKRLSIHIFHACLSVLLYVVLFFFYFQFFAMFLFDFQVDFIVSVTGEQQRLAGHTQSIDGVGVFNRTAGIFAEPALHAYILIVLLICMINIKTLKLPVFIVSIFSIWLSLSASGILLSIIPIAMYFIRSEITIKLIFFGLVFYFFYFYFDIFYLVFEDQFLRLLNLFEDDSGSHRLEFVNFFIEHKLVFFGGFGVFVNIMDVVPPSSFFVSLIYCFGFPVSLLLLCAIFIKSLRSYGLFGAIVFNVIFILVAYPVSSPFFWFAVSLFHTSFIVRAKH